MSDLILSISFAILAAIAWGLNAHVIKQGMVDEHPMLAVTYRSLFTFPILFGIVLIFYGLDSITQYFSSEIFPLVLFTSGLVIIGDGLFMNGLKKYPVKILTPISSIYPLVTTIIVIATGTETVGYMILLGTIAIIIGVALVTSGGQNTNNGVDREFDTMALFYGLVAAVFWGTSIFFVRKILEIEGTETMGLTGTRTLFMGLGALLIFLSSKDARRNNANRPRAAKLRSLKFMALSGLIGWVIGATLFFFAVQKIGAAIPTPITSTNPIIAVVFGRMMGIESISSRQFAGIIFSVLGTIIIVVA